MWTPSEKTDIAVAAVRTKVLDFKCQEVLFNLTSAELTNRIESKVLTSFLIAGTGIKKKYIENIYGGVELTYAFQVPQEPVVPKLIQEIVRINDVINSLRILYQAVFFFFVLV